MKILIIKTSSLGDIIQALPVVTFLKKRFPKSEIDWVAEKPFCELLEAHPQIARVIPMEIRIWKKCPSKCHKALGKTFKKLREKEYDLLFDLQGNIKSGILTYFVRAKQKIGTTFSSAAEWPNALFLNKRYSIEKNDPISLQYLSIPMQHFSVKSYPIISPLSFPITSEETAWVAFTLRGKHRTMVCLGSHWENKKLGIPTWIELLKAFPHTHFYFVWGNEKEKQEACVLQSHFPDKSTLMPRMRLPLWQYFMSQMDVIYTVDSSALHLAATTSVPTYSFFGPSNASIYKPPHPHHYAIQGSCPYGRTFIKRCPILRTCKTGACLKSLKFSQINCTIKDFF